MVVGESALPPGRAGRLVVRLFVTDKILDGFLDEFGEFARPFGSGEMRLVLEEMLGQIVAFDVVEHGHVQSTDVSVRMVI